MLEQRGSYSKVGRPPQPHSDEAPPPRGGPTLPADTANVEGIPQRVSSVLVATCFSGQSGSAHFDPVPQHKTLKLPPNVQEWVILDVKLVYLVLPV